MCISASYHHSGASAPSTVKQDEHRLTYATSTNTHLVVAIRAGAAAVAIVGINQGGGGTTTTLACLDAIHIVAGYHDTEAASPSTMKQDEYRLTHATSTKTH